MPQSFNAAKIKFFWVKIFASPNVIQPVGMAVPVAPWKKEELSIGKVCTGKAMETHFYSKIFFFFHYIFSMNMQKIYIVVFFYAPLVFIE